MLPPQPSLDLFKNQPSDGIARRNGQYASEQASSKAAKACNDREPLKSHVIKSPIVRSARSQLGEALRSLALKRTLCPVQIPGQLHCRSLGTVLRS